MAKFPPVATPPSRVVTRDMTAMIYRLLAFYSLVGLLPSLPRAVEQIPRTEVWASVVFGGGLVAASIWMIVLSLRRRSIRPAAGAYAAITLGGLAVAPWVVTPSPSNDDPWLWGAIGTAVVCAGIWLGGRFAIAYAALVAVCYVLLRVTPQGGARDTTYAICAGVFASGAGLAILAVALGMITAASAADDLAARVHRQEVDQAVDRAVSEERTRLDQLIHDDVMTTLTATAHASDPTSVRATASLAKQTLAKIEDLATGVGNGGAISYEMLGRLAADTSRRVSPEVTFVDESTLYPASARLPIAAAETLLSAMREAVRNALRHSGAQRVEVSFRAEWTVNGRDLLTIRVRDDGSGFDPDGVPATRLGIRLSMTEPLAAVGAYWRLDSTPGAGTTFEITRLGNAHQVADRAAAKSDEGVASLPAEFPVRQLAAVTWAVVLGEITIGLINHERLSDAPSFVAMELMCVLIVILLHSGRSLRLPTWAAVTSMFLIIALMGLMDLAVPTADRPDIAMWQGFPMQLVLVILIIRRRPWFAALGLMLICALLAVWCSFTTFGWTWVLGATFGPVAFVLMAVLVNRVLLTIARRQRVLRVQERAAIDDSVRRHVALVQRWLWVSDLKAEARETLRRISEITDDVPADLRAKALLVEATLREALSARNVMNEELADLTEDARRRGVSVTFVDSRSSPVSGVVGRAVMAEVRTVLDSASVSRLVVRLGPDDGSSAASVVTDDGASTSLTTIDPAGTRRSRRVVSDDR